MVYTKLRRSYVSSMVETGAGVRSFVVDQGIPPGSRLHSASVDAFGDLLLYFDDGEQEIKGADLIVRSIVDPGEEVVSNE